MSIVLKYKKRFAKDAAFAFQQLWPTLYAELGDVEMFSWEELLCLVERPKNPKHGWLSIPVFKYAKLLKDTPGNIGYKVSTFMDNDSEHGQH